MPFVVLIPLFALTADEATVIDSVDIEAANRRRWGLAGHVRSPVRLVSLALAAGRLGHQSPLPGSCCFAGHGCCFCWSLRGARIACSGTMVSAEKA